MKHDSCVILVNSAVAKIYSFDRVERKLVLLDEESHPKSTSKDYELVSDEFGQYQKTNSYNQGTYSPNKTPKEIEAEKFAVKLAEKIENTSEKFDELFIFSATKFGSLLNERLKKSVLDKITSSVNKDYTKLHIKELEEKLIPQLIYPENKNSKMR